MAARQAAQRRSPVSIGLADLLALRSAGESISLPTSRVRVLASGGHLSTLKGRGVEYDESRPYQPGDDLRTFDWRVTARTGKPHTKIFREERNRPVLVWLDLRRSMNFATRGVYKSVLAAETAALIAWTSVAGGDRLGGLIFSDSTHQELRPALGRRATLALLSAIAAAPLWQDTRAGGDTEEPEPAAHALERLVRVVRPGSLVFMLSDFRGLGADARKHLWQLRAHSDLVLMHYFDPLESELPPPGRYRIQAGRMSVAIHTGGRDARERYRRRFEARRELLNSVARLPGVRLIECATTDDPRSLLAKQFMKR
jgi:uncharacterized protein (DUF58 family)